MRVILVDCIVIYIGNRRAVVISSDNGIYILKSKDGYRVVHAQAIENIYTNGGSEFDLDALADYFGPCNVLKTEEEAWAEAKILYNEIMNDDYCPILEYGVVFIKGMENREFPVHLIKQIEIEKQQEPEDCPICEKPFFYGKCSGCGYIRK